MSEFVKPKVEIVRDKEYVEKLLNIALHKDLLENEEVCQLCHGTGLIVYDNPYGLKDDPDKRAGLFPYKQQALTFCPICYHGVVKRCPHCGKIIKRSSSRCDCDATREIEMQERKIAIKKLFDKAPIAPPEIEKTLSFYFSEDYGENDGYFSEWDEFFEYWFANYTDDDEKPEYVWITEPEEMSIDAGNIIESATDDLYEDASYDISTEATRELQSFLDDWCKRCGIRTTYYESHKYKVKIPWEEQERYK